MHVFLSFRVISHSTLRLMFILAHRVFEHRAHTIISFIFLLCFCNISRIISDYFMFFFYIIYVVVVVIVIFVCRVLSMSGSLVLAFSQLRLNVTHKKKILIPFKRPGRSSVFFFVCSFFFHSAMVCCLFYYLLRVLNHCFVLIPFYFS